MQKFSWSVLVTDSRAICIDFDPEDLNDGEESSDNQSSGTEDGNANAGREHYVAVG